MIMALSRKITKSLGSSSSSVVSRFESSSKSSFQSSSGMALKGSAFDSSQICKDCTRTVYFHNEEKGFMRLAGDVFDVPIRKDIVHRVLKWQLANRRQGTHSTKTISEVSGTGRKPLVQKGSGRARHGSLRGPQFRDGATMHGPKPRDYAMQLQKKGLNVYSILQHDTLVMSRDAVDRIVERMHTPINR